MAELGASAEGGESQVDEEVVATLAANGLPVVGTRYAADQGKGAGDAAEDVANAGSSLELDVARKAAALGDESHERLQDVLVLVEQLVGELRSGQAAGLRQPGGEEALFVGGVAENVEHAGGGGDARTACRRLDPRSELVLSEELLERPVARDDAIALEIAGHGAGFPLESRGNDEQLLCELPGRAECDGSFLGVLDHVHYVAEVTTSAGLRSSSGKNAGSQPDTALPSCGVASGHRRGRIRSRRTWSS